MSRQPKAVTFNLDAASLASLRDALPGWTLESVAGATTKSLEWDCQPAEADLLVVSAGTGPLPALALCRGLRSQAGRARTPLLVLVPAADEELVREALAAGADSCLWLPIHAKEVAPMLRAIHEGNRPGRHTLGLTRAQEDDPWRDDGGQG